MTYNKGNLRAVKIIFISMSFIASSCCFSSPTTIECFIEGSGPLVIKYDKQSQTINVGLRGELLHAAENVAITESKIGFMERFGKDTSAALIDRATMAGRLVFWKDGNRSPDLSMQCIEVR